MHYWTDACDTIASPQFKWAVADPKILKGGNTIYQSRCHLLQMHTTNYIPFTQKKAAFWRKKNLSQYIGAAAPIAPLESATVNEHSLANILQYKFGDVQ